MDTNKIAGKARTQMIAHRGLSGVERENTVNAFVAACNRSYFGVECDIHATTDNRYLVYHDDHTGRLCDKDLVVEENSFDTLRGLRIRESGGEGFDDLLKMPTLEEYLHVIARYKKTAVIELKNQMERESIWEVVEICRKHYTLEMIIFISFVFENLAVLREILPQSRLQFLTGEWAEDLPEKLREHRMDVDIGYWVLTEENIKRFHESGIAVNCWTCDDPEAAKKLIAWGVDYLTTNILE